MKYFLIGLFVSIMPFCGRVEAASFDCSKANSNLDRAICGSDTLSSLDEQLAKDYDRGKRQSTGDALTKLVGEQREWLRRRNHDCGSRQDIVACLESYYKERIQDITGAENVTDDAGANNTPVLIGENLTLPKDYDPKRVQLLYSARDEVCRPLVNLYDRLNHIPLPQRRPPRNASNTPSAIRADVSAHGESGHDPADLEEYYALDFSKIGFNEPEYVDLSTYDDGLFSRLYRGS